ncbi:MAG TPA: SCO family protein [Ideonella sp.]|nr:SCO family protein [Ideonella sp.]
MSAQAGSLVLGVLVLAGCLGVVFEETAGLRVLTSSRRPAVQALQHPRFELPLRGSSAGAAQAAAALPGPGRLRVVEITFERCRTVCTVQGGALADAFVALQAEVAAQRLQFVSLSIDPGDCPEGIAGRVRRLSAGRPGWDGVCVQDQAALRTLARRIGVVALRDGDGDYRHTAGVFLVGAEGRVMAYEPSLSRQTLVLAIQQALQGGGAGGDG